MEKCYEFNITVHQLYVDFKAAYDSINRQQLLVALHNLEIPRKLIKMTLENTESKVRVNGQLSDVFSLQQGLRQGDSLSSTLFNLALEEVIRKIPANRGGTLFNRTTQNLAFADDIAMLGTNSKYLKENLTALTDNAATLGLVINREKTKYMINTRNKTRWKNVKNFENFERVETFKYLGGIVTENNDVSEEIKARLAAGNRCYFKFLYLLKSSLISRRLKLLIYKSIIKPVVLYGSETWTLTKTDEELIQRWERKVLRRIFGAICVDGFWRMRTNKELDLLYQSPTIVREVKARRIRWLGHVQRMEENRVPKKVLCSKPEGSRSVGRPRLRWLDDVEADLKELGVKSWKKKAKDRVKWKKDVVDKVLGPKGAVEPH